MAVNAFKTDILRGKTSVTIPEEMTLHGALKGENGEIIVLVHIGRMFTPDAYVCHITNGRYGEGVYDMPGFPFISISFWEHQAHLIEGNYYIMVCRSEAHKDPAKYKVRPNWL